MEEAHRLYCRCSGCYSWGFSSRCLPYRHCPYCRGGRFDPGRQACQELRSRPTGSRRRPLRQAVGYGLRPRPLPRAPNWYRGYLYAYSLGEEETAQGVAYRSLRQQATPTIGLAYGPVAHPQWSLAMSADAACGDQHSKRLRDLLHMLPHAAQAAWPYPHARAPHWPSQPQRRRLPLLLPLGRRRRRPRPPLVRGDRACRPLNEEAWSSWRRCGR